MGPLSPRCPGVLHCSPREVTVVTRACAGLEVGPQLLCASCLDVSHPWFLSMRPRPFLDSGHSLFKTVTILF